MECSCSCSYDYDAPSPSVYRETEPVARKPHRCVECGEPIRPGQRYHRATGIWDGSWSTFSTCSPCATIRAQLCACGWSFGCLRETLWECLGFDYLTNEVSPWAERMDEADRPAEESDG